VHVWCRGESSSDDRVRPGLNVHRVAGSFDRTGLRRLTHGLEATPGRRIVLIQYVPHAYGNRGMNLPFCFWVLGRQRQGDEVRVMFHEVYLTFTRRPLRWNVISLTQRVMAATLLRAASTVYVSTEAWIPRLRRLGLGNCPVQTLSVPSNVPLAAQPERIAAARCAMSPDDHFVVGHFGTYSPTITALLDPIFNRLSHEFPSLRFALFGRGAAAYRRTLLAAHPDRETKLSAFDDLRPDDVTAHVRAADLMLQPYPDGATFRRGSLMACLAAGAPTITTFGLLSEAVWQTPAICEATPVGDVAAVVEVVRRWIADPATRTLVGRKSADYYRTHFSLERTVEQLLGRRSRHEQPEAEHRVVVDR